MFVIGRFRVKGSSMEPLYPAGSFMLCIALPVRKGDVVIVEKNGRRMLKRVQGLPGTRINGKILSKGYYYVLGYNPDSSTDSRSFGAVHRKEILGKAFRLT